jgi:hypothetical protein
MSTGTACGSQRYAEALGRLAEAHREAEQLATILDYFASILRGAWPDPDGPAIETFPSLDLCRRVLESQAEALERAEEEWQRLPPDERERVPQPAELE